MIQLSGSGDRQRQYALAGYYSACYFTSVSLSLHICKTGISIVPPSWACWSVKCSALGSVNLNSPQRRALGNKMAPKSYFWHVFQTTDKRMISSECSKTGLVSLSSCPPPLMSSVMWEPSWGLPSKPAYMQCDDLKTQSSADSMTWAWVTELSKCYTLQGECCLFIKTMGPRLYPIMSPWKFLVTY